MKAKSRLDIVLTEQKIAPSRQIAQSYIIQGFVKVNGIIRNKPGFSVTPSDIIELSKPDKIFASRGGLKLEHALDEFSVNCENCIVLDAGASTGGFTDCVLKKGAAKVYAVDVGKGQLDYTLRQNERVVCIEGCNIRYLEENAIPEKADLITADVSFISLSKIMPVLERQLKEDGIIIALIKPQFEAGKGKTVKGVIKDSEIHKEVLKNALNYGVDYGLYPMKITHSPIKGPSGNIEFFIMYSKQSLENTFDVENIVNIAWSLLNK